MASQVSATLHTPAFRAGTTPSTPATAGMDARTRRLLDGPIAATLLRLAVPTVLVMVVQTAVGLVEAYFVGRLGTAALAGVSLVFPLVMLMQMMSAGAMGGGISSAVGRALGAARQAEAEALAWHALAIGAGFGLVFTAVMLVCGRAVYSAMGGQGATLDAALGYSNVVFAGAVLVWLFNSLASIVRGTGNMMVPAAVTVAGAVVVVPLSPALIFGLGPFPRLGVIGGAAALLAYYALGSAAFALYLCSGRAVVRLKAARLALRWSMAKGILRVGLLSAVSTVQTNLTVAIATALVGGFGSGAIAGYGTGARLEYLLVPLVFGLGAPLVTMVATNLGAGQRARAYRVAWIGALIAAAITEVIGVAAAAFPLAWLELFGHEPAILATGAQYLRTVGPVYGLFGLGLALYFATQGAGRMAWPLTANLLRLCVAAVGGWLALRWGTGAQGVFTALALGLVVYGAVSAWAAWKGWLVPRQ